MVVFCTLPVMDRAAIFVDAGYLFAQASTLFAGRKLKRSETRLDEVKALAFFESLAGRATGLPLLRIYWYDGTEGAPSAAHVALAHQPNLKLRLGLVNAAGEQRGVDSLLVSDLITLSRNRAMSDAVVVTGDEDIRVGVQHAQDFGVRVHLVGIEPARWNQSNLLRQDVDTIRELTRVELETFMTLLAPPTPAPPAPPEEACAAHLETIAESLACALSAEACGRVASNKSGVPPDVDRQLLQLALEAIGEVLPEQEKRDLRRALIRACRKRA